MTSSRLRSLFTHLWSGRDQYKDLSTEEISDRDVESCSSENTFHDEKQPVNDKKPPSNWLSPRMISDATIGLSEGLTVPFALTAGLSAFGNSSVVIYGGIAELLAGSISMGLGGYLGAKSEAESCQVSQTKLIQTIRKNPAVVYQRIQDASLDLELPPDVIDALHEHVQTSEERTLRFLSKFDDSLGDASFESRGAYLSAATIAAGYFVGGFIPLVPYFFLHQIHRALLVSVAIMAVALFLFGFFKTRLVGQVSFKKCVASGLQMTILGGCAAAVAVGCVKLGSSWETNAK